MYTIWAYYDIQNIIKSYTIYICIYIYVYTQNITYLSSIHLEIIQKKPFCLQLCLPWIGGACFRPLQMPGPSPCGPARLGFHPDRLHGPRSVPRASRPWGPPWAPASWPAWPYGGESWCSAGLMWKSRVKLVRRRWLWEKIGWPNGQMPFFFWGGNWLKWRASANSMQLMFTWEPSDHRKWMNQKAGWVVEWETVLP